MHLVLDHVAEFEHVDDADGGGLVEALAGVAVVEVKVYHENKQGPYLPDPDDLPELDFEQSEMESPDSIVPIWQRKSQETTAQQESSESHKHATKSHSKGHNKANATGQSKKKSTQRAVNSNRKFF